ncbi:MAG TPA: EAL domain-containing protein [Arenimonas sp.]|nr:EAL domain-containing protein [Arenimonas sp.]
MNLSNKEKLISLTSALLGALMAMLLFTSIAYWIDSKEQEDHLHEMADKSFQHAHAVMLEFENGLLALASLPNSGCTDQTIKQLRAVVKNSKYLKSASIEIGKDTFCTDSNLVHRFKPTPDFTTGDGTALWLNRNNLYSTELNTIYLQRKHVILSTLESHLLNMIAEKDFHVILLKSNGNKIMAKIPDNIHIYPEITAELYGRNANISNETFLYESIYDPVLNFTVITAKKKHTILAYWFGTYWLWLPIGLLCGLLAGIAMFRHMESKHTPMRKLVSAIKQREFIVHYQPIISLLTSKCIGAETLIRWQGLDGELIRPDLFIPLAEDTGLIEPLTDLILDCVIKELSIPLKTGDFYISINLSARDMAKPRFYKILKERLHLHGIAPDRIAIEATEHGFMDVDNANDNIKRFRDAGHSIFIDDFGTGYSSLSYLQNLAIDVVKIDKSFVEAIETGSVTSSVIGHIIAMAKQLKLKIVAEGVETAIQAEFLRRHGVDAAQGYYYAQPMPAHQFLNYVNQNRELADL